VSQHNSHPPEEETWFSRGAAREPRACRGFGHAARRRADPQRLERRVHAVCPDTGTARVEARVVASAGEAAGRLGLSRRRFLSGAGGMAASFIAMNEVFGRFFDASPVELVEPAAAAERGPPPDLFRAR